MAPKQKGKQGTKGAKQIVEDNKATLSFYRNMALGSVAASLLINYFFFELRMFMSILSVLILVAAYQFMVFMARPSYSTNAQSAGTLVEPGTDLDMEGGIAEHAKDLIILTSGTLLLTLLSNYFWFLLLLAPFRALWLIWGLVIGPWLKQQNAAAEESDVDEKKQRKMERKMRRMR